MPLRSRAFLVPILLIGLLVGCEKKPESTHPQAASAGTFPIDHLGSFYQANGYMEMDQHKKAAATFEELLAKKVRDPAVLANLAACMIALQNFEQAEKYAVEAAKLAPDDPDIALTLAAALEAHNKRDESLAALRETVRKHSEHVRAHYALISALESRGSDELLAEMGVLYDRLLQLTPRNFAALLAAAHVQARRGELQAASRCLDRALALVVEPPEAIREHIAQMDAAVSDGDKDRVLRVVTIARNVLRSTDRFRADVLALGSTGANIPDPIPHPLTKPSAPSTQAVKAAIAFEDATEALGLTPISTDPSVRDIVVGSVLEDRSPALFVLRTETAGQLFVRRGGKYEDATASAGLDQAPPATSAVFIDINNDRRMDLLLCCPIGMRLFLQGDGTKFTDATASSGLTESGPCSGAVPFDFDQDGDLDLLSWDQTRLYVHMNDGEGKLKPIDRLHGLSADIADIHSIQPIDLDDDGDTDLCVTTGNGPFKLRLFSNERLSTLREVTSGIDDLKASCHAEPMIADFDNDGWWEMLNPTNHGGIEFGTDFAVRERKEPRPSLGIVPRLSSAEVADSDGDGLLELLRAYVDGSTDRLSVTIKPGARLHAVDLNSDGLVDLISSAGQAFQNKTQVAGNWLSVGLAALITGDSRFNAFGIGSTIEIRAGDLYQKRYVTGVTTHFGLGPYNHADVLRVTWPNGNYQNLEFRVSDRMSLKANQLVVEEQSLKGSCPYLYTWNGQQFEFVTDVLWRSALGMFIMADVYGHHGTADDYFKISGDQLQPRDGQYVLQFTEELWETAYFDYTRLFVVDHPIGTDIFVDEKCLSPPYPAFEIFKVRERRNLACAIDHKGEDVTALLAARDHRYVADLTPTKYQGIMEDHDLILDLGEFDKHAEVRLFLNGWLWPTDASTNMAVSQNSIIDAKPPTLSVIDEAGSWKQLDLAVGFPSGKSKTIVLDLTGRFPTPDHRVKLATNFAIYWDEAFFAIGPQDFEMQVTELLPTSAELHYRGFSHEYRVALHGPVVPDYAALDPERQWRDLVGDYTRFGDVTELLQMVDSMYAIIGAGDEVTLRFDAKAVPDLPAGWRRDFVIHTDGWLKDGDLNSATGKTVDPLPFHGMSAYPYPETESYPDTPQHRAYREKYNTRRRDQAVYQDELRGR